jgi:hypothetical protein
VILPDPAAGDAAKEPDRVQVVWILKHRLDRSLPRRDAPRRTRHTEHIFEMTPRLWLMKRTRCRVTAGARRVEHLGLDRGVEPGRRLVED